MFKEVRRSVWKTSDSEANDILMAGQYGILSTVGEDGYAYGVPLSYVYTNNAIYFHSALEGHKLENLRYNEKASFCVVGQREIVPEKFTTKYESVIVFGRVVEVVDQEKEDAFKALIRKYSSDFMEEGMAVIKRSAHNTKTMKLCIEHMSGKAKK